MKNLSLDAMRRGRLIPWLISGSLSLTAYGLLPTDRCIAQTPSPEAKIITPPPPPPLPALRPGTEAADARATAVTGAEQPAPPAESTSELKDELPSPFDRQGPVTPGQSIPRVIPIEPVPGAGVSPLQTRPRIINIQRDSTGLVPTRPPGTTVRRPADQVAKDVANLVELVQDPEAEIAVVMGESKIIQTRRTLTRVIVSNPSVADVELLTDQPDSRLLNIQGKSFGNTSLTLWDETNHPVSFLVRVTLDTKELESRINQSFPGAHVKVRQVSAQIILDGQVPDSKMMADILQVVQTVVRTSGGIRAGGGGAAGGAGGGMGAGGGGAMGGAGGGAGGMAGAAGGGLVIVNRVVVPGPRQVLLHVKVAELNRSAIRTLGISWLDTKGRSIIGSPIGAQGTVTGTSTATHGLNFDPRGLINPLESTYSVTGSSTTGGTLFGIFNAGHFSLFINALRDNSLAKVLSEPNLMALDGQPARFLVGGQFPFPVPQSSSIPGGTAVVTIQFRRFGTILNFIPQILPNDVVRLDVEPVVSRLDFTQGTFVNGGRVPAILERSARTVVELREGQTLAIAGLLQLATNASTIRVPGLGDLPIVGPWFSNNNIETLETETIILVTPELVAPLEKNEVTEAPGDRVFQPNDAEFYFLGRIEGKLGREFRATKAEQDPLNLMKHFDSEKQWVIGPHGYAD